MTNLWIYMCIIPFETNNALFKKRKKKKTYKKTCFFD